MKDPSKILSEYPGKGTESYARLLRQLREDAAEEAADEAKHAAIRNRPREPVFRVDDDADTRYGLARLTDDVEIRVGSMAVSRGVRRGQRVMFLAFYQRTPGVGDGWSLMGKRVLLDRRQLLKSARALHEMLRPERLLAFLDRPHEFYGRGTANPDVVTYEAYRVWVHLRGLTESATVTREDVRTDLAMKTANVVAALRYLDRRSLVESAGGVERVDDSTNARRIVRRGVRGKALRWRLTAAGRSANIRPHVYNPKS